jgi:nucleotide-binding universal stress UspA family protein
VIVVGVDTSMESKEALRWAARQAEFVGGSLRVILAWHPPSGLLDATTSIDLHHERFEKRLDSLVAEVLGDPPSVEVTTMVVEDRPAPALIEAGRGADLLVVGSRGQDAFPGMLLGPVSQQCVMHAPCSVAVIRPHRI